VNTKSSHIPTSFGDKNTGEVNKASRGDLGLLASADFTGKKKIESRCVRFLD
jgi:hypothetical protein